jgi:serine/threonine protein phosphatase PrpC
VALIERSTIPEVELSPAEHTSNILASFFGLPLEGSKSELVAPNPPIKLEVPTPRIILPPKVQRFTPTRSVPITFATSKPNRLHRLDSAPTPGKLSPPSDFIDPKDGHIWRAKYCVLNEGFLYFYQNATEGESPEAIWERQQPHTQHVEQHLEHEDLSKSPLTRKSMTIGNLSALNGNGANSHQNVIWEKRVTLDQVGAVRSAEFEYGKFAFELLAEDGDRLILRANDSDDLNEWLFQFHRSLASLMKNFVDAMGRYSKTHVLDLCHRTQEIPQMPVHIPQSVNDIAFSSRFQKGSCVDTWSHKHGRSRRVNEPEVALPNLVGEYNERKSPGSRTIKESEQRPSKSDSQGMAIDNFQQKESAQSLGTASRPVAIKKVEVAKPKNGGAYMPPHLRRKAEAIKNGLSVAAPAEVVEAAPIPRPDSQASEPAPAFVRGGCSDPRAVGGSIVDAMYKKRKSSVVGKVRLESHGCYGGGRNDAEANETSLRWEVGAVSECGVRSSNEDSFLVCSDARKAFGTLESYEEQDQWGKHDPGIFGIFDGHCGNEAARFATERITEYFYDEWKRESDIRSLWVKHAMQNALARLDKDFCKLCVQDGRDWDSGATAIVVAIVNEELIVSNLGDCRAVVCRSAVPQSDTKVEDSLRMDGWTQLEGDEDVHDQWIQAASNPHNGDNDYALRDCYWKEMAAVHTPSRADEKRRIESANGWITVDQDVPYGQMRRMDFCDKDVLEILQRCFSERYNQAQSLGAQPKQFNAAPKRIIMIERVCGDLGVTRAIGDRDFKAEFNQPKEQGVSSSAETLWWDCSLALTFPNDHSRQFKGDLVSSVAETRVLKLSPDNFIDEFLVLACDGLWDVLDPDEAVRVTRGLLFEKKWSAEKAAERLAELAIHLGSADNVTVIVIRFFRGTAQKCVGSVKSWSC